MGTPQVALVVVSHSAALAQGVAELAGEMAPDVTVAAAGGASGGGLGTDLDLISGALGTALAAAAHVVVLYDLGSAQMTAAIALETVAGGERAQLVDAPLVEGALAAAVTAQGGDGAEAVARSARDAAGGPAPDAEGGVPVQLDATGSGTGAEERRVVLINALGLHARPAAQVAALTRELGGATLARGDGEADSRADATSLLQVVGLALRGGDEVVVRAGSAEAARRLVDLIGSGFGEDGPGDVAQDAPGVGDSSRTPASGAHGSGVGEDGPAGAPDPPGVRTGAAASPGLAVGPVVRLAQASAPVPPAEPGPAQQERLRSDAARSSAVERLDGAGAIGAVHAELLGDVELGDHVEQHLEAGADAATAWWRAGQSVAERLAAAPDRLVAERAIDVRDAVSAVLHELGAVTGPPAGEHLRGAVVVAEDVLPSWLPALAEAGVAALVLGGSGPTAHAAVVARGRGLPAVVALGPLGDLPEGRVVVVDGSAGTVEVEPDERALARARLAVDAQEQEARDRRVRSQVPVVIGGRTVAVAANVASVDDARRAAAEGADGIGLLRTELLLTDRPDLPSEDEQTDLLVAIARTMPGRRVVVRTFDVGGDKPVPALRLDPAVNGFLGERGLRYGLTHRELLDTQLRAVVRAAELVAREGVELAVMAPMVSVAAEVRQFREAIGQALEQARVAGHAAREPSAVGIMVEVPAAALAMDELTPLLDFVSIGTNDLVQYVMAAERTTEQVRHLYLPHHPAVTRVLETVAAAAHAGGCEVAVCGSMAAEPGSARWLAGELGVTELSVPPADVGRIKDALRGSGPVPTLGP